MDVKNKIINQLNKLKVSYFQQTDKKWQIKSLQTAIQNIEKYDQPIISGNQLKEEIKGIGQKICKYIDEIIEYGYILDLENKDIEENSYKEFMEIIGVGQAKS